MGKIDSQMDENRFPNVGKSNRTSDGGNGIEPQMGKIESNLEWGNRFLRWGREYLKDRRSPPIDLHYV